MKFGCVVSDTVFVQALKEETETKKQFQTLVRNCLNEDKRSRRCGTSYGPLRSDWKVERYANGLLEVTIDGPRHSIAHNCPYVLQKLCHGAFLRKNIIVYDSWRTDVSPIDCDLDATQPMEEETEKVWRQRSPAKYRRRKRKIKQVKVGLLNKVGKIKREVVSFKFALRVIKCPTGVEDFRDRFFPGREAVTIEDLLQVHHKAPMQINKIFIEKLLVRR